MLWRRCRAAGSLDAVMNGEGGLSLGEVTGFVTFAGGDETLVEILFFDMVDNN